MKQFKHLKSSGLIWTCTENLPQFGESIGDFHIIINVIMLNFISEYLDVNIIID